MRRLAAPLLIGLVTVLLVVGAPANAQTLVDTTSPSALATPEPSPSLSIIDTGDPRSNGQGPGLVGSPFAILLGVIVLGLVSAAVTVLYLRIADRR